MDDEVSLDELQEVEGMEIVEEEEILPEDDLFPPEEDPSGAPEEEGEEDPLLEAYMFNGHEEEMY